MMQKNKFFKSQDLKKDKTGGNYGIYKKKSKKKAGGKRRAGRIASMCLAVLMAAGIMAVPAAVSADSTGSLSGTYVSLGADLSSGERATVLSLLGLTEDDLKSCTVINVTNQEEHQYLDSYLSSE